ncbi:MAG: hypothetical protein ABIV13_03495 [Fimbriimonadales bacterium]
MVESLKSLLGGIIDYAGMYPPAQLPLSESLRNYIRYKNGKESWIVNRFVCPASKVSELEAGLKWHDYDRRFGVCLTGSGGDNATGFVANTLADLKSSRKIDKVFFDAFETRLPASELANGDLTHLVMQASRGLEEETLLYLEVPLTDKWRAEVPRALDAIARNPRARAKVRCGGPTADAFPNTEQVAAFIAECAARKLPFKATAGLHHPIRTYDEDLKVSHHGFLNVFIAAAVALSFKADAANLVPILATTDASDFRCLGTRLSVGNWHLSLKQLREARDFAVGYGSCSVSEPLADLAHLGYAMKVTI